MNDALGDAVRTAVRAHVDAEPVDPSALLTGVLSRRATRRWVAPVAAAAAVALVAGGAVLVRPSSPAPAPVAPAVPVGLQAVSWHGVQVLVPAAWRLDDLRCSSAQSDTVLRPGARLACLAPQAPGLTVVEFEGLPDEQDARYRSVQEARYASMPVDLGGTAARRGAVPEPLGGQPGPRAVLVVPSLQVVVTVTAPSLAAADALLDTATVVEVDANGCRSRVASTRPAGPASRDGADERLLPGAPTSVSVCRYGRGRLDDSRRLSPDAVTALQTRLDGLPTGRSDRVPVGSIAADLCPAIDDDGVLLDAAYRRGPGVQVWVRDQACTDRSTTNGSAVRRAGGLDTYALLRGEPLVLPPARKEPAPELGYAGLPRRQTPPVPAQRADVLARTDDPADGRLLGVRRADGRRCLLLATSEATPPYDCEPDDLLLPLGQLHDGAGTWAGTGPDVVRAVRVLVDGRQVAVVPTWGGGAAWGQRRGFLVRLPSGATPVFVPLDGLGRDVVALPRPGS